MFPPHLPPPTCNVNRHRQWGRLKNILISTFFGLLAGLTGSAIMLGWIWPMIENDYWFTSGNTSVFTREQLQNRAETKISDKIFTVYKKSNTLGGARYFSPSDKIADGVMSVTSGWLVMNIPQFDGRFKDWVAVSPNGSLFQVEKALSDKRTDLLFVKLSALNQEAAKEQFKVATFNTDVKQYDNVFVFQDGRWLSAVVTGKTPRETENHLDSIAPMAFSLNDKFRNGSVAIDKGGNVIGFVADESVIVPLVSIDHFLSGIDEKTVVQYPSLGVEGWYGEEKLLVLNEEKTNGFIVTKVVGNKQFFQRGDIILEINGRQAEWGNVWYTILDNRNVRIKIWRAGKTIESEIPIVQL